MKKFYAVSYAAKNQGGFEHGVSVIPGNSEQEVLDICREHFLRKQVNIVDIFAVELNLEELGLKEI